MIYLVICIAFLFQDSLQTLGLRYTDFISPLVKGMQELAEKKQSAERRKQPIKAADTDS
jgi:hypothetical protein